MTATWLDAEISAAARSVRQSHIDRILALGVAREPLAELGKFQAQFGIARIRTLPGNLYEPDEDGEPHVVMPVIEADADDEYGLTVDLIAWHTSRPNSWRWRTGEGWALGLHMLDEDMPVPVARTPLEWLGHGGNAIAVLDWHAPARCWRLLREGPPLILPDQATRRRMQNAFARSISLPKMEVRSAA